MAAFVTNSSLAGSGCLVESVSMRRGGRARKRDGSEPSLFGRKQVDVGPMTCHESLVSKPKLAVQRNSKKCRPRHVQKPLITKSTLAVQDKSLGRNAQQAHDQYCETGLQSLGSTGVPAVIETAGLQDICVGADGIVRGAAMKMCNILESLISRFGETPPHVDPKLSIIKDNTYFAPVDGESPLRTSLEVVGEIPNALNGIYVRTGPNPQMNPSAGYSFFDGDGMLHAVRIRDGGASYCARYVKTARYVQEQAAKQPLFVKPFGELHGIAGIARMVLLYLRSALGLVDLSKGLGAANTGLTFFNGHLLAMSEDDSPYVVQVKDCGDVETMSRFDFSGALKGAMTSHPKVDPVTGEMFAMSSNFGSAPFLKYFIVSPDGVKGPDIPINLKAPMIAHDFAVTKNFVVLPDLDLVINIKNMIAGGSAIAFDRTKIARLGVLPRYAQDDSEIVWFELDHDSFCFHYWTAWEEGDEIVLTGSILLPAWKFFTTDRLDLRYQLTEFRLNMATGKASKRCLVPHLNLESGQINQRFYGRKTRYVYLAVMDPLPTWVRVTGVAKIDLQANGDVSCGADAFQTRDKCAVAGIRDFSQVSCLASEPFFVPRTTSEDDAAEDDGYVVTYLHDQITGDSELLIMDAQSPTLKSVASVKLPRRVPYGLHGIFLNEEQLKSQKV